MDRALIVRKPWIDMILSGEKVWEMRSRPTNITGRIGLIEQGTGLIVGEGVLVGTRLSIKNREHAEATKPFHRVDDLELLKKMAIPVANRAFVSLRKACPILPPERCRDMGKNITLS